MSDGNMTRRNFAALTVAAVGGMMSGCGKQEGGGAKPETSPKPEGGDAGGDASAEATGVALMLTEPHVCCGLNTCKGKGKTGENDCAGMGACATESIKHACGGLNACKGQGGCGETAGRNACKAKGDCSVPLHAGPWKSARAAFEKAWEEKHGKKPGGPPESCEQAKS